MKKGTRVRIKDDGDSQWRLKGMVGVTVNGGTFPHLAINGVAENKCHGFFKKQLEPVAGSIDTLVVGDVIEDKDGDTRKVLGMQGDVCFMSWLNDHKKASNWYTKYELKDDGYTFSHHEDGLVEQEIEAEDVTEMTVREVADKLGVKNLHITDN